MQIFLGIYKICLCKIFCWEKIIKILNIIMGNSLNKDNPKQEEVRIFIENLNKGIDKVI